MSPEEAFHVQAHNHGLSYLTRVLVEYKDAETIEGRFIEFDDGVPVLALDRAREDLIRIDEPGLIQRIYRLERVKPASLHGIDKVDPDLEYCVICNEHHPMYENDDGEMVPDGCELH